MVKEREIVHMCISDSNAETHRQEAIAMYEAQQHDWSTLSRAELEERVRMLSIERISTQLENNDLRQAQANANVTASQLQSIQDHTRYGFAYIAADGQVARNNANWRTMMAHFYGKVPDASPKTLYDWAPVGKRASLIHDMKQVLAGESISAKYQSGKMWFDIQYNPVYGPENEVIGAIQWLTDISEHQNNRRALEIREAQNRQILDILPIGIVILHRDALTPLYANPTMRDIAKTILGDDASFLKWFDTLSEDQRAKVMTSLDAVRNQGITSNGTIVFSTSEAAQLSWRLTACPIEFNTTQAIIAVVEDVTGLHQQEEHERETQLHQERMRLIAEFIQDAAHEFKTPLSNIHTSAYMLERTNPQTERNQKYIDRIEDNAGYITQLVEGMLMMARLDAGTDLSFDLCDLNQLLQHAVMSLALKADEKEVRLAFEPEHDLPPINGDQNYLVQSFTNLIDNALNHTEAGDVVVIKAVPHEQQIQITVQDNGVGMQAAVLDQATERFFRDDTAHTTRGFGLGLPIADEVVKKHGGTLILESVSGLGTIVTITLPIA